MNKMKFLVIGATGSQGGHVARHLLMKGHSVRAVTRNTDSKASQELIKLGAEMMHGDITDAVSIKQAASNVDAIFAMTTPFEAGEEVETKQGITIADVAKSMGKYLVFSSVGASNRNTGIPHFESKWKVEQHIKQIGLESAVIAPVYFHGECFPICQTVERRHIPKSTAS